MICILYTLVKHYLNQFILVNIIHIAINIYMWCNTRRASQKLDICLQRFVKTSHGQSWITEYAGEILTVFVFEGFNETISREGGTATVGVVHNHYLIVAKNVLGHRK